MSTVAERVSAGIALLDEEIPNWRDKIDLTELNIRSTRNCVLGQVFKTDDDSWENGYDRGRSVLNFQDCSCCSGEGQLNPYDYGFDASQDDDDLDVDTQFNQLQEEWKRQLSLVSA
jgi:hypothetical protein